MLSVITSTNVTVGVTQSSVAEALPVAVGVVSALHSTIVSAGIVKTGAVVSNIW